jgi:hypothetical protein
MKYHGGKKEGFYLGIELEAEGRIFGTASVRDAINNKLRKRTKSNFQVTTTADGGGTEVQFPPMTFQYIKNHKADFKFVLDFLRAHNFKDDGITAGMHVHISKTAYEPKNFIKLVKFLATIKKQTTLLSRRSEEHNYAQQASIRLEGSALLKWVKKNYNLGYRPDYNEDLYEAGDGNSFLCINRKNYPTIEFRMFQSTLDINIFLSNIELIHCWSQFAKTKTLTWDTFVEFVKKNKKSYSHLADQINKLEQNVKFAKKNPVVRRRSVAA